MILIVGGGIGGLNAAIAIRTHLSQDVTLIDEGHIGEQGASSVPVALLNIFRGRSANVHPEDRDGLRAIATLSETLELSGIESGVVLSGVTRIAANESQAKKWESLECIESFSPSENPREFRAPFGGFDARLGGWVETRIHLNALHALALRLNVDIREESRAISVERLGTSYHVRTHRDVIEATHVVDATGARPSLPGLPKSRFRRVEGGMLSFEAPNVPLETPLIGLAYLIPGRSAWHSGGLHNPKGAIDSWHFNDLHSRSIQMIPDLANQRVRSRWQGVRAVDFDDRPKVAAIGPNLWHFGNFGGRGFLTAAFLATRLSRLIGEKTAD